MSIFRELKQDQDIIKNYKKTTLTNIFENDMYVFKDTGWGGVQNTQFAESPLVVGNSYFVNNNDFSVSFISNEDPTNFEEYLSWNSFMSSIGAPYDSDNNQYNYKVNGTNISQAIVVQFNREYYEEKLDFDNFFIALSNQTGDTSDALVGSNFDLGTFMVLAPYYNRNKINIGSQNTILPHESYELRTSDDTNFLTFNIADSSISIDWDQGTISSMIGEYFPTLGCIVIFPELIPATYSLIQDTITGAGDRSESALNTIMYIGGYGKETISQEIVFVRLNNADYNYSSNPTAFRNVAGKKEYLKRLFDDRVTYPTTIGLFNDKNECLATVALSKGEKKSPVIELPFRVEINI